MDRRFVFSSTYSAWNKLSVHYNSEWITLTPQSKGWIRKVAPIANSSKKVFLAVAFVICTIATGIFSLLVLPFRLYKRNSLENQSLKQDADRLSPKELQAVRAEVSDYIDSKQIKGKFPSVIPNKDEILDRTAASYARSIQVYGPVAVKWVDYLLDKANKSNQKLVFMARDGIAPYKMALEMMKDPMYKAKYPNMLEKNKIALAYFSRSVVNESKKTDEGKALFRKYASQLGINDGDQCIFVDIGFTGSMINSIRAMLPKVKISFDYLISHTNEADGFIYSDNDPSLQNKQTSKVLHTIQSISYKGAGSNFATHWLEDYHQGVGKSATCLVEIDGIVYPNTRIPGKKAYIVDPGSHDFLIRKWASRAIHRSWKKHYNTQNISKAKAVANLDETLREIVDNKLKLLIKHI